MAQHRSMILAGQILPRVIIKNILGQNKVVYIDPFRGTSSDLNQRARENKNGLKVSGESVDVIKGTGPGSAMGVLSPQQQIQLMESALIAAVREENGISFEKQARDNIVRVSMNHGQPARTSTSHSATLARSPKSQQSRKSRQTHLSKGSKFAKKPLQVPARPPGQKPRRNLIVNNIQQVRISSNSIEKLKRQHQLLCDTVVKKRNFIVSSGAQATFQNS